MLKKIRLLIIFQIIIPVNSYCLNWTFLTYIAAKNNLNPYVASDLNEMQKGTSKFVNTLVYLNIAQNNQNPMTKKLVVSSNKLIQIGKILNLDSGNPKTLIDAIKWAYTDFPSKYFVLDLWNHGSAMYNPQKKRAICFDDITGNYITDNDLKSVLAWTEKKRGKKIDILIHDACFMACIEWYSAVSDHIGSYIIGSQESVPDSGFGYNKLLNQLSKGLNDIKAFAYGITTSYKQTNSSMADYTMSTIDVRYVKPISQNVFQLGKIFIGLLNQNYNLYSAMIENARNSTKSFYQGMYIDLTDFYTRLLAIANKSKNKQLTPMVTCLTQGLLLFKKAIVNNVRGSAEVGARGLSIYFPDYEIDPSYYDCYFTKNNTNWVRFLEKYLR